MSFLKIKGTDDIERKMLACAIDISETEVPEYLVIGYRITESGLEFNADSETGYDINGRNFSSVNKFEPSQSFDPHRVTAKGSLGKLSEKLIHYFRYNQMDKFSQFKCIIIYGFLDSKATVDTEEVFVADLYDNCTVLPQSIGGESWTDLPFTVNFGGNVTHGYVSDIIDEVTFYTEAELDGAY